MWDQFDDGQKPDHEKKRYWGRHFWARGYFCATVDQITGEMIQEYIEHHFEPNPSDHLKMEVEPH
jgi:putative transposase